MKYEQVNDGDYAEFDMPSMKFACCDCGLVHQLVLFGERLQVFRCDGDTEQIRKQMSKKDRRAIIEALGGELK